MNPWWLAKNLPFAFESWLVHRWNQRWKLRPTSEPFVSGDGFREACAYRLDPGGASGSPEEGGFFFVHGHLVPRFWAEVRPLVRKPFVLVSHNSDWVVEDGALVWLEDPLLVRWFAQNAKTSHPKLVPIPIGLENATNHSAGVVSDFVQLRTRLSSSRKNQIIYGFSVNTNFEERVRCWRVLRAHSLATALPQPLNHRLYRRFIIDYQFIASPEGNGPDCHRTWEALLLGVIPIVTRSPLIESFVRLGLPLLVLDTWEELPSWDGPRLAEFYEAHHPDLNHPALTMAYWRGILRDSLQEGS
jgi:hypothetical protein